MKKRRSISEISKEMDEINRRKPTANQIEELAEALNKKHYEPEVEANVEDGFSIDKIASSKTTKDISGIESNRI